MLYRTHHPLFYPFSHSTTSIPYPSTTATTALSLLQAQQGMDCVEGALKSSFRPEMAVKKTQQLAFLDDMWTVNCQGGVSGDDFVDDLLDFSKGGMEDGFFEAEEELQHEQDTKACFASPQERGEKDKDSDPTGNSFLVVDDFPSNPCSELSVPADDLANLEWLSHFVDDSFSEYSLTYPAGKLSENRTDRLSEPPEIPVPTNSSFTTPVHTKARSKRARTGGRVWLLGSPSLTESSSSSSSSSSSGSSSSTTSSSHSNPWLIYNSSIQTADSLLALPQPSKKQKQKRETSGGSNVLHQPRRCSHCLVQKTPQWRTGPFGAKTLCNACGVRYKSGRLLPEYRPACSPTFSSDVHSNNHRKVLEMRRQKEVEVGLPPPVQSF